MEDKEKITEKEKIIESLMRVAKFGHIPACSYDKTEECAFSRDECKEALKILCLYDLRKIKETGGCLFVSRQYYYDYGRDRYAKYNDLELYDNEGVYVGVLTSDYDNDIAEDIDNSFM